MNNKTDIEEDIKEITNLIDIAEIVLPKYSTEHITFRISEEQKIAIENILVGTERVLEKYKRLQEHCKTLIKEKQELTSIALEDKANKYDALVEKIKDKIKELKENINTYEENEKDIGFKDFWHNELLKATHKVWALQELIDTEEE